MGLFRWLFGRMSNQDRIDCDDASSASHQAEVPRMSNQDRINCDDVPPASHQAEVHRMAREYLACFANLGQKKRELEEMEAHFDTDPLLGLEVSDEALVLHKNEPQAYPRMAAVMIAMKWKRSHDKVVQLRGGRERASTSPTLRGGAKRSQSR